MGPCDKESLVVNGVSRVDDVLGASECGDVAERMMQLSESWIQRAPVDFYTLGAASYLDGAWDQGCYQERRKHGNQLLAQSFPRLYETLLSVLTGLIGQAQFHPDLALPGFHVFAAKPDQDILPGTSAFAAAGGSIHQDLQYTLHTSLWRTYGKVDWGSPLSFTLPIELPEAGGGLNVWPGVQLTDRRSDELPERIAYRPGSLYWFFKPLLHQIAPLQGVTMNDRRITLQGHGLRCDGVWILYF